MTKADLLELLRNGENSGVELKLDTIEPRALASRNQLLKDVMRDYGYLEHMGMGVPRKIIRVMREHNGTEPDLVEEGEQFTVRLWKEGPGPA